MVAPSCVCGHAKGLHLTGSGCSGEVATPDGCLDPCSCRAYEARVRCRATYVPGIRCQHQAGHTGKHSAYVAKTFTWPGGSGGGRSAPTSGPVLGRSPHRHPPAAPIHRRRVVGLAVPVHDPSMMSSPVTIPFQPAPRNTPGPWWTIWRGSVFVQCPAGHRAAYGTGADGHTISPDGKVTPSTVCPTSTCTWHVWTVLEDWRPGIAAEPTCPDCGYLAATCSCNGPRGGDDDAPTG